MAANFSVAVNIGARIGAGFESTVRHAERRFERMGQRLELTGAKMKAIGAGGFGAIGMATAAGYAASRAMRPFLEFEEGLAVLGDIAEITGPRLEAIGKQVVKTGAQFGMGGREALGGAADFLAGGLELQQSMKALEPTLKLVKVARIDMLEGTQSGIALMQNLSVSADKLGAAYDAMALAGKRGRFEIDAMAKAFPGVSSRATMLGMSGLDGVRRISSMLQVTRETARDEDEAANSLINFFDNVTGTEAARRFAKVGMDIEGIFARSQAEGKDFVRTLIDEIAVFTDDGSGGVDAFKLGQLFRDRQAKMGALALIQNRDDFDSIYAATGKAGGTLDTDFANRTKTAKFGLDRFSAGLEKVGISLGRIFGPSLGSAAMKLGDLMSRFADWAEKHPMVIKSLATLVAGFVGLKAAVAGGAWLLGSLVGSIGGLVTRLSSMWRATLGARMAFAMLARFGLGALLTVSLPVAAAIGAIALALGWVIAKWDGIKAFFSGFADGFSKAFAEAGPAIESIKAALAPLQPVFDMIADAASAVFGWFASLFGAPAVGEWRSAGEAIGSIVGGIAAAIAKVIGAAAHAVRSISALWKAVSDGPSRFGNWAAEQIGFKPAGARALGGSVSAGAPYLVGERGPELVVPGRSGTVIDAATVAAINRGAGSGGGSVTVGDIHFHGVHDGREAIRQFDEYLRRKAAGQSALLSD